MEDHAQETEARAQALCKSAMERLKLAEIRTEAAERARRELITEAECKLQDASSALTQAQSRIEAAEDRLTAVEFRAQAAEAEAREAKQALALVEEAIRRRLLCPSPHTVGRDTCRPTTLRLPSIVEGLAFGSHSGCMLSAYSAHRTGAPACVRMHLTNAAWSSSITRNYTDLVTFITPH